MNNTPLHNNARVNENGEVVDPSGEIVQGAFVRDDGIVIDGVWNVIDIPARKPATLEVEESITEADQDEEEYEVAPNPDVPGPPETTSSADDEATSWGGIIGDDFVS